MRDAVTSRMPLSNFKALMIGSLVVESPILMILCAPAVLMVTLPDSPWNLITLPISIPLAWLWWSLAVPRWRMWAYERVVHVQQLERAAVRWGLTWRKGS
jgi:hypothetical protein